MECFGDWHHRTKTYHDIMISNMIMYDHKPEPLKPHRIRLWQRDETQVFFNFLTINMISSSWPGQIKKVPRLYFANECFGRTRNWNVRQTVRTKWVNNTLLKLSPLWGHTENWRVSDTSAQPTWCWFHLLPNMWKVRRDFWCSRKLKVSISAGGWSGEIEKPRPVSFSRMCWVYLSFQWDLQ